MNDKPPLWADWLLTAWVIAVGVFYFGGTLLPDQIGRYTAAASAIYALLLLASAGAMAARCLGQSKNRK
jgi:CHASE2 domain-containing sensor protein